MYLLSFEIIVCWPQESCHGHKNSFKEVCLQYLYSLTASNCLWEVKYKFITVKITNETVFLEGHVYGSDFLL